MKCYIKRFTAFCLAMVMTFALLEIPAFAEEGAEIDALTEAALTEEAGEETPAAEAGTAQSENGETPIQEEGKTEDTEPAALELSQPENVESEEAGPEKSKAAATITGFVGLNPMDQIYDIPCSDKPSLQELTAAFPAALQAYLDGADTPVEIPVTWFCVGADYATDPYYFFQFSPEWDETQYVLSEDIDLLTEAPYIFVRLMEGNGISLMSASEQATAEQTVYDYLKNVMNLNTAAACGVMANIYSESAFFANNLQNSYNTSLNMTDEEYTAAVDDGTYQYFTTDNAGYGLTQWTYETRKAGLLAAAQAANTSIGDAWMQMGYLEQELNGEFKTSVLATLQAVENTEDGAYEAAYAFCYNFEKPANYETVAVARGNLAKTTYWEKYSTGAYDTAPELDYPELSSVTTVSNGLKVTWSAVAEATSYNVYRTEGGSWTQIATGLETLTYTDTSVTAGVSYSYTVQACNSSDSSAYAVSTMMGIYYTTPVLSTIGAAQKGIIVTWKSSGAPYYRVFRKVSGGTWERVGVTTGTSFTDKTAETGVKYTYTVRCLSADQNSYVSSFNSTGLSFTLWETPELTGVEYNTSGIKVSWNAVPGVTKYRFYRKTAGSSWVSLATVTETSYIDKTAKNGVAYTYTVRCISDSGLISGYDATGLTFTRCDTPTLTGISGSIGNVTITWKAVTGVIQYRVYRKESGGTWKALGNTTATSFTDKTAAGGKTYYYTVRCVTSTNAHTSGYDTTGLRITPGRAPALTGIAYDANGIKLTWDTLPGETNYRVFRKVSGGSWTRLTTTTATSYIDKTAKNGVAYTYTVRCVSADGSSYTSSYDSTGLTMTRCDTPQLSTIVGNNSGITLTWKAVTGAFKYRVFRKVSGGNWSRLGETTSTSFTDKTAANGTAYTYTVRCITSSGSYASSYNATGLSLTRCATPALKSISNSGSGVTVTWGAVSGAKTYRVFRKVSGGSWARIGDTTSTSYTDTSPRDGVTCFYTVRCISGSTYVSGYDTVGLETRWLKTMAISSLKSTESQAMTLTWAAATGVTGYQIQYCITNEFSGTMGTKTVTGASTTSASVTSLRNSAYYVRMRSYYTSGSNTWYSAWSASKYIVVDGSSSSGVDSSAPTLSSVTSTASKAMTVTWGAKSGVDGYEVQYCTTSDFEGTMGTKTVTGASTTSVSITSLRNSSYYVRVRSYYTSNGSTAYSAWSSAKQVTIMS